MGQFAGYRNRNPRTKSALPLLIDIQADLLEGLRATCPTKTSAFSAPSIFCSSDSEWTDGWRAGSLRSARRRSWRTR
jgi:hypothetical protein